MKSALRLFSLIIILSTGHECLAQQPLPPRSIPLDMESIRWYDTYMKITYSRPHKNGRKIFGDLVPYGEVWQIGANESTEVMVTKDILVGGDTLAAGAYTMLAIPEASQWTMILNSEVGQWGSYKYNPEFDVMRLIATVKTTEETWEPLTIRFDKKSVSETTLTILWDNSSVSLPIAFLDH